jgi:hypothetical protein
MRNVSVSAGVAGAAIAAALALLSLSSGDAAVSAPLASGRLLTVDGEPAPDASVTLSVLTVDTSGTEIPTVVGQTTTDADGKWQIDGPDEATGLGQMEIVALVGDRSVVYDYVAAGAGPASRGPGISSTKAGPVDLTLQVGVGEVHQAAAARRAAVAESQPSPDVLGDDGSTGTAVPLPAAADRPVPGPVDGAPDGEGKSETSCWVPSYQWHPTNHYREGWVPIKWTQTEGKSTVRYAWTTSAETLLGVAVVPNLGANYAGGAEYSVKNQTAMTISPTWPNNTDKTALAGWIYRKMQAWCPPRTAVPHGPTTAGYPLSLWKWRAWRPNGYSRANTSTDVVVNCVKRGPVAFETTLTRAHTQTFNSWFSIVGVGLRSSQTQSDETSVTVYPDAGKVPRYCSSDSGGLRTSAWIWESN